MGTLFKIVVFTDNPERATIAAAAAFQRVRRLNAAFSDYEPDSELMRLCRQPIGQPAPLSAELFDILRQSQTLSEISDGTFDVTLGPLTRLWRESRRTLRLPTSEARAAALRSSGYRHLHLDRAARSATLLADGMRLDLGGIAKGYAADEALAVLRRHGFLRAMVAASGDLALGDPPPGARGWKVALAPFGADGTSAASRFALAANVGVSTSSGAEQFAQIDGVRYSHVVDPSTGLGLTRIQGAAVIASRATLSDAWATACCVLAPEQARIATARLSEPVRILIQCRDSEGRLRIEMLGDGPPGLIEDPS